MSDLDEMWKRLEQHQSRADQRGYGLEWRVMCEQRTEEAAESAAKAAWAARTAAASKAAWAAWAAGASWASDAAWAAMVTAKASAEWAAMEMAAYAINRINRAEEK